MDQIQTGQLHRLSTIQLPIQQNTKRISQVEFPVYYHLLNCYVKNLMENEKLDDSQKIDRLKEFGGKLGNNVMESISSTSFDKIRLIIGVDQKKQGKYTEYIKFLGRDFWQYMFGQKVLLNNKIVYGQIQKVQMNTQGTFYELEDKFEEQIRGVSTTVYPGFQMTRRVSIKDQKTLDKYLLFWAKLVQGMVLGGMKALGIDCECDVQFINGQPSDLKFTIQIIDPTLTQSHTLTVSQSTFISREQMVSRDSIFKASEYKY